MRFYGNKNPSFESLFCYNGGMSRVFWHFESSSDFEVSNKGTPLESKPGGLQDEARPKIRLFEKNIDIKFGALRAL